MAGRGMAARALAVALLLLASAVAVTAEPFVDGFETGTLDPAWIHRAEPGRVTVQRDLVRSGEFALRVEVRERDVAGLGGDGEETERTERMTSEVNSSAWVSRAGRT